MRFLIPLPRTHKNGSSASHDCGCRQKCCERKVKNCYGALSLRATSPKRDKLTLMPRRYAVPPSPDHYIKSCLSCQPNNVFPASAIPRFRIGSFLFPKTFVCLMSYRLISHLHPRAGGDPLYMVSTLRSSWIPAAARMTRGSWSTEEQEEAGFQFTPESSGDFAMAEERELWISSQDAR